MSGPPGGGRVRPMNDAIKHLAQAETGSRVHRRRFSFS